MSASATRRIVAAGVALLTLASPAVAPATYSIVARDPATGEIGAAVQSHWFQVSRVIWVEPGVGAVATQSLADFSYGPAALELLGLGRSAAKTLEGLLAADTAPFYRQVAVLDADGDVAAHTGDHCIAHAGHVTGEHYSVQANLMHHDTVPAAMARAFEEAQGDLAERMMAALEAAQAEGGDIRGKQSAAILVARPESTGRVWEDLTFDLRVDDAAEPLSELRRLLDTARAYRAMNTGDGAIEDGEFERAAREYGRAAELAPGNSEVLFWYAVSLANEGHVEDAEEILSRVYAMDAVWRELPARLVAAEILTVDEETLRRLESAAPQFR